MDTTQCLGFILFGAFLTTALARRPQNINVAMSSSSFQIKTADAVLSTMFSIKPVFSFIASKARDSMVSRGLEIGVDWASNIQSLELDEATLRDNYDTLLNKRVQYPSYYTKPFHAYEEGNLSWRAAMEVESAALTVHAPIYSSDTGKKYSIDGDFTLRDNFHRNIIKFFENHRYKPKRILDIGCSTGLSTLKMHRTFPEAEIIGLDLSPYFLAVATRNLVDPVNLSAKAHIKYLHGAGEDSTLGPGDVDFVTLSLVNHELPETTSRAIIEEAYRILPPGGAIAIMDMNPKSPFFIKFASNPFAFAAFKSTEPWIQEYIALDLEGTLEACGFKDVTVMENSPRHRSVMAFRQ